MGHDPNLQGLLHVSAALLLIIVSAQLCGRIATWLRQPAVLGEMVSGVLLGPTLLGAVWPGAGGYLFTAHTKPVLYAVSMIGLSLYMFLVGVEHEHPTGTRRERTLPLVLAVAGLVGPIALGAGAALLLVPDLRPPGIPPVTFALFVGGALAVTAFPMLARILQERNMMHTEFGRVATSAAAVDDALAWCVLAVCGALVTRGTMTGALATIIPAAVLVVAAFLVLPRVFRRPLEQAVRDAGPSDGLLATLLGLVLAVGWFTDYIGIYSVFGGFICGVAMPRVRGFAPVLNRSMLPMVRTFFLPVFFAFSGLNTDLGAVFDVSYLLPMLGLLVVAVASKSFFGYLVLRKGFGWGRGESIAMGGLMNARGLMILIFINVGLALGAISRPLFSMLVVVAVVTTGLAMPVYRRHFTPEVEAAAREAGAREPDDVPVPAPFPAAAHATEDHRLSA